MSVDRERRFGGVTRLYGKDGAERLHNANICVVGIGGVGSWSAEALARTGVGQITVIDLDMVAESNTNRQIHALGDIYGKSKVDAISERILAINPDCKVSVVEDFVTPENVKSVLDHNYSVVIDAIDQVRAKAAMLSFCRKANIPVVVAGAAGGKIDPTRISVTDLSRTIQDPLLAKVRSILRREYGFPKDPKKKFNVSAVYSTEPLRYPDSATICGTEKASTGLNCAGFGSSVCVTSVFGMVAAAEAIRLITRT